MSAEFQYNKGLTSDLRPPPTIPVIYLPLMPRIMEWIRGIPIGRGSSASVHLALLKSDPAKTNHLVVKSSDPSTWDSLHNERRVLRRLGHTCPHIIRFYGDNNTGGLYNLFFEHASGGSLSDHLRRTPTNRLPELQVRNHTNSILRGLHFIHHSGFAHCDIKLQNLLLFANGRVKIADFGLAREINSQEPTERFILRGTPLYMAPEVVAGCQGDTPADVWALGCAVVEMTTGNPAWRCDPGCGVPDLLCRIAAGNESPAIPESLSEEGKDFVSKCFIKDPSDRWTAGMLLDHPFVSGTKTSLAAESPTGPFDFPDWTAPSADTQDAFWSPNYSSETCSASILGRIDKFAVHAIDWSGCDLDRWVTVR